MAKFQFPTGVAVDDRYVYVADSFNNRIQKFTAEGAFVTKWGVTGIGPGQFNRPSGVAVDNLGQILVADAANHRVQVFSSTGTYIGEWGSQGSGDGQFDWPRAVTVDAQGFVYVGDFVNFRVQKFTTGGAFVDAWPVQGVFNPTYGAHLWGSRRVKVESCMSRTWVTITLNTMTMLGSF